MERQFKHDVGYWMSILGFALVIFGGLVYSFFTSDVKAGVLMAVTGFLVFLFGAELALRNQKHLHLDK